MQQRFLPATGVRGTIGEPQPYPLVQVGRRLMRLAPGARVFDQSNRTLVHAHIPPGAEVLFATEQSGDIIRLYILTEQEIGRLAQSGTR